MNVLERVLVIFPQLLLFGIIMYDVYRLSVKHKSTFRFDTINMLMMVMFFAFYGFLLDTGVAMTYALFESNLTPMTGYYAGLLLIPMGYVLTKELFYIQFGDELSNKKRIRTAWFLHYFVFSSGALAIFTGSYYILYYTQSLL